MKRTYVFALALLAHACSNASETEEGTGTGDDPGAGIGGISTTTTGGVGAGAGMSNAAGTGTPSGGTAPAATDGVTEPQSGGNAAPASDGALATATPNGDTVVSGSGGVAATAGDGAPIPAAGSSAAPATGGSVDTAVGGITATTTERGGSGAAVDEAATGGQREPGASGAAPEAVGGAVSGAGGATETGAGGRGGEPSTGGASGGSGGGLPSDVVTTATPIDPAEAADGLPHYYIAADGDDGNSGTSPEDAWATVANVPTDEASAVFFERGGTFEAAGAPARGRNGPAAFNVPNGSVWTAYGDGDERPILTATEQTEGRPTGAVLSPGGGTVLAGLSFTGRANFGLLIETDANVIQDCEIDGTIEGSLIELGFSVRGHHNLVVGNHIHSLHEVILDSGNVNTSGGAEAIVVNGTDQEIAYNTIEDCWTPNETLGGAEGGCLEIIARSPGEIVENVYFHHNYCERSVGLFEACAGNFDGTAEKIQEHHAVVRNTVLAYNVVVDAMWLYLLQTANTDFDGLVFEHNTLVHGPVNDDIPQRGADGFGNFYDTDRFVPEQTCSAASDCGAGGDHRLCLQGTCYYQFLAQPGTVTVRNNLFVVLEGGGEATMKLPPGEDDVLDNIFSPQAPQGVEASRVTVVADPGLVDDTFRIGPDSPAIDQGGADSVKPWPDFDGNVVPCGEAPDVGAIEYCP